MLLIFCYLSLKALMKAKSMKKALEIRKIHVLESRTVIGIVM